jgi:ComF family protein
MIYDEASRDLVLAFKYADRTDAAPAYGAWLARAGGELLVQAELVVPVPLHWTRLFGRRYNQAQLLARAVGRMGGCAVRPDLLRRSRKTSPQGRLTATQRRVNLAGAFAVGAGAAASIRDRRVLLVDDVLTTGTTASACARTLLGAGAGAVDVLTLARVVRAPPGSALAAWERD